MTRFLLGLVAAVIAPKAFAATGQPLGSQLRDDLQNYLTSRKSIEHISAVSMSVGIGDEDPQLNIAVGTSSFDGGAPVTPKNLFQIGSNTKAFTAVVILQLEAEGKLSIKQTIGDWLPQYPAWKNVTIQRLLDMTSGIPSYTDVLAMRMALAANPARDWSPAELISYVYPTSKGAPPPTKDWSYSNTNYLLAQLIIEKQPVIPMAMSFGGASSTIRHCI